MKSLFAIIKTKDEDRKILYANEDQFNLDQVFNIRDGENSDIVTYRDKITQFFQQYQYFGLIQKSNFLGYSTNFIIDFFSQERKAQCHELMIEDLIFYIQNIKEPLSITLVLVIQKESQYNSQYAQYYLTFIKKCLQKIENESQALTRMSNHIIQNISLFEKEINSQIPEYEKQKCKSIQVRDNVTNIAKKYLDQCELRKNLNQFSDAFTKKKLINFFQIQMTPPQQDLVLNPISIVIKPYQTLLLANFIGKDDNTYISQRFLSFIQKMQPTKSFQEMSNLYYFSMNEIQVYVNHIMINNQNQMSLLLNKITDDSYFTIACTQTHKKLAEKIPLKQYVSFIRCPMSSLELRQDRLIEKIDSQFCNIIGFRLIRECQVYLYQKDPTLNFKRVEDEINKIAAELTKAKEKQGEREKKFTQLIRFYQSLVKFLGKPYTVQEIAYQKNMDISRLWVHIHWLKSLVGFYCL
ncbi:unnamed protein product [Paramecium sonneborni]|uniref:Uncharacterized protein n=1 Tax=Paramecium sonneborni TaxID=65129 RepID=A0A8S1PY52_9CILI|nr:unnamed protein product [Paramecium sonneborni]